MSDVRLYQTLDDGDIVIKNGIVELEDGEASALYLSWFGGNQDDPGEDDETLEWWGNKLETDPKLKLRSRTQFLLGNIPLTTGNVQRIRQALEADAAWTLEDGIFTSLELELAIPKPNRLSVIANTNLGNYAFEIPWEGPQ